jgi:hypothetical protein
MREPSPPRVDGRFGMSVRSRNALRVCSRRGSARHLWPRAFDRRNTRAPQALHSVHLFVLIWLCSAERRERFAWGCRSFLVCTPLAPDELGQPFLVEDGHRRHGTDSQELRRNIPPSRAPSCDAIGDYRLICRDVVRRYVLDGDLLLASASVVVEPFGQHHDGTCRFIGKL